MNVRDYQRRRDELLSKMVSGSAALFFSAPTYQRNADNEYPYRQDSYFWYMSAFDEPDAVFLLIKDHSDHRYSVLFHKGEDPQWNVWKVSRFNQEQVLKNLAIDHALLIDEIDEQLHLFLNKLDVIYYAQGLYDYTDKILFTALDKLRRGAKFHWRAPSTLIDWRPLLDEMRLIKSEDEIKLLRRAAEISALGHERAMKRCQPGLFEFQLEGEMLCEFAFHGARYCAYEPIIAGGKNACILHYSDNKCQLNNGELVLIDVGCEYQKYAGDITRTFPVNGVFTPIQRSLYTIVLTAQERAISFLKPGNTIHQANQAAIRVMVEGLLRLGILHGEVDELLAKEAYKTYYMHGISHWLGLDVHDVGEYGVNFNRTLEEGMVLTCEPGLYFDPCFKGDTKYRGIGIRIEDDILITKQGNEVLSQSIVKSIDGIESLMSQVNKA